MVVKKILPVDDAGAAQIPSVWLYAPAYPDELFAVEGRWRRTLMQLGFKTLTVSKVSRRLGALFKRDTRFTSHDQFRCTVNEWLRENGHMLVISRRRMGYVFSGDERADINALLVDALAAVLDIPKIYLFADRRSPPTIGVYRCIVVLDENIHHRAYVAVSELAATQRCMLDLLIGPYRITARPYDWYQASIECVELQSWQGGIAIEELFEWIGRTGMKSENGPDQGPFSLLKDRPS